MSGGVVPEASGALRSAIVGRASGYASPAYAAALVDLGRPRVLPASGASLLLRTIPGSPHVDACGPYPLLEAPRWSGLAADVAGLVDAAAAGAPDEPVSLVAVVSPFCEATPAELADTFGEVARPFKEHLVVELGRRARRPASRHHERNARRALAAVDVDLVDDPAALLDDWCSLYGTLRERHAIVGAADFSRESFERQLRVPGLTALRAVAGDRTVGMTLWLETGDVGYYHLGAYSAAGYELGASFALFASAIEHFRSRLAWLDLGAGAGLEARNDGLTRFKQGWATGTRPAYLCGRVLDPVRYRALAAAAPGRVGADYFPAYRTPV